LWIQSGEFGESSLEPQKTSTKNSASLISCSPVDSNEELRDCCYSHRVLVEVAELVVLGFYSSEQSKLIALYLSKDPVERKRFRGIGRSTDKGPSIGPMVDLLLRETLESANDTHCGV